MLSATEARNPSVHGRLRNPSTWRRQVVNPTSNSPPRSSQTQAIRRTGYSAACASAMAFAARSEEHTSELQSLMRISYAVFCLKKKKTTQLQTDQYLTLQKYTHKPDTMNKL